MDGSGSCNLSISADLGIFSESSADPPDPCDLPRGLLSVDDLGKCFGLSLSIRNDEKSSHRFFPSPEKSGTICFSEEDESNECHGTNMENPVSKKCFDKCATAPCPSKAISISSGGLIDTDDQRGDEETSEVLPENGLANQPRLCSVASPTPLKLVSAMKGTREKLGNPRKNLSVTWAPDVYDPPPSAASHVPRNKPPRHRNDGKRNWKNKQKVSGKSTRGSSKGKDKKQARKRGGSSSNYYKPLVDEDRGEFSSSEPQASIVDYDVGNPEAFCGSSFLKTSVTEVHFSVAQAT